MRNTHCIEVTTGKHSWAGGLRQIRLREASKRLSVGHVPCRTKVFSGMVITGSFSLPVDRYGDHKILAQGSGANLLKRGLIDWRDRVELDSVVANQEQKWKIITKFNNNIIT